MHPARATRVEGQKHRLGPGRLVANQAPPAQLWLEQPVAIRVAIGGDSRCGPIARPVLVDLDAEPFVRPGLSLERVHRRQKAGRVENRDCLDERLTLIAPPLASPADRAVTTGELIGDLFAE